jgi:carbonic anhydrase/SulP family sulfate permease
VLFGTGIAQWFQQLGGRWLIGGKHMVEVPVANSLYEFCAFFQSPDFSQWNNPAIYTAAVTIALVASLETLLNLEAVDKIDRQRRSSPPSRELLAQGIGNVTAGLLGGIPITSVVVRGSVNINAGAQSKTSTIFHGVLLLVSVMLFPHILNMIPLSCLAAILLYTGIKLASPTLVRQMWQQGRYQFIPFAVTVVAIVFTDLLIGILIGLAVSISFILNSNLRRPIRRIMEKHLGGDVLHIELANQVSFLNRAALLKVFESMRRGSHLLLDAQNTDYMDPDVLELIREFREQSAPARGVTVSLVGFRKKYHLDDQIQYVDHSTRELQAKMTPAQVLQLLRDGNDRFRTGQRLTRDLGRQVNATAGGQHPLAVVLTCIDSRTPSELIFDLGVGDVFSVRIAGNVISRKVLGSIEYSCAVAGAKLILVLGHTRCGAVTAAVTTNGSSTPLAEATGCEHVEFILREIVESIDQNACRRFSSMTAAERVAFVDEVATANVLRTVAAIPQNSRTLAHLLQEGKIAIVGAMYDVTTGKIAFLKSAEPIKTTLADSTFSSPKLA